MRLTFGSMASVALIAGTIATLVSAGADAAVPRAPAASLLTGHHDIERVTFWARPFPYGYSGWRRCHKQRVLVETSTGPRWRRVCV